MMTILAATVISIMCSVAVQAQEVSPERKEAVEMVAASAFVRRNCPDLKTDRMRLAMSMPSGIGDLESFISDPVNNIMGNLQIAMYEENRAQSCRELYSKYGGKFLSRK